MFGDNVKYVILTCVVARANPLVCKVNKLSDLIKSDSESGPAPSVVDFK